MEKRDLEHLRRRKEKQREWWDWIVKPTTFDLCEELMERQDKGDNKRQGGFTRCRGTFWLFAETM